jgi:hypothetical protein
MKRFLLSLFLLTGLSLLISADGCAIRTGYYAPIGPPAPRYGVIGVAPGPGYIWTDGFYAYRGGNYAWTPGRWARPPRSRSQWVPGRWEQQGRRYRFHRGYWR